MTIPGSRMPSAASDCRDRAVMACVVLTLSVSYSLPRFDVCGACGDSVNGTDTHDGRVITTGISWPFER